MHSIKVAVVFLSFEAVSLQINCNSEQDNTARLPKSRLYLILSSTLITHSIVKLKHRFFRIFNVFLKFCCLYFFIIICWQAFANMEWKSSSTSPTTTTFVLQLSFLNGPFSVSSLSLSFSRAFVFHCH